MHTAPQSSVAALHQSAAADFSELPSQQRPESRMHLTAHILAGASHASTAMAADDTAGVLRSDNEERQARAYWSCALALMILQTAHRVQWQRKVLPMEA